MKKIVFMLVAALFMTVTSTAAFAHGHGYNRTATKRYSVCNVQDCTQTGRHTHNGGTYTAHYYGDGHDYHDYCTVEDCILTGYHEHDGAYCFAHTANHGYDCCAGGVR